MHIGILLGFLAYFVFSLSDAALKAVGGAIPVFELGFFLALFAMLPALFTKRPEDTWRNVFTPNRPWLVLLRMATGTVSSICAVIAFTTLPLAEAYAMIFLTPMFVTILSRLFLGEAIGWKRWAAVFVGLAGVLLVVRPGFRELLPGHFAALAVAFCGGITVMVLRMLGPGERPVTLMGAVLVGSFFVNGILMIPEFRMPEASLFPVLVFAGVFSGLGHLSMVFATRIAPANRIGPTQYSQIVWAALIGALFFGEFPDGLSIAGMVLVGLSGLFTFMREEKRTGWSKRTPLVRERV